MSRRMQHTPRDSPDAFIVGTKSTHWVGGTRTTNHYSLFPCKKEMDQRGHNPVLCLDEQQ
ncbi:hypothetical protein DPMN_012216 [Dreissena polymorpha]|uniref:Uncharacterized protein n=1 Tax=Dreissena polymorpha TaxID=45954 RepID=A0A9D4N543_DREPO|nr:hypothetical protein DPMN_012216 [Dreissena polymorpha]